MRTRRRHVSCSEGGKMPQDDTVNTAPARLLGFDTTVTGAERPNLLDGHGPGERQGHGGEQEDVSRERSPGGVAAKEVPLQGVGEDLCGDGQEGNARFSIQPKSAFRGLGFEFGDHTCCAHTVGKATCARTGAS